VLTVHSAISDQHCLTYQKQSPCNVRCNITFGIIWSGINTHTAIVFSSGTSYFDIVVNVNFIVLFPMTVEISRFKRITAKYLGLGNPGQFHKGRCVFGHSRGWRAGSFRVAPSRICRACPGHDQYQPNNQTFHF